MRLCYSLGLALAAVLTAPVWLWRMLRQGRYRAGLRERLGSVPRRLLPASGCIWIHAVSVGEVLAVSALAGELGAHFSGYRTVVSTTTDTGQNLARQRFGAENVFYFPLDFAFAIRPYLRALRPEMVVLAETEFWPNFLRLVHHSGARLAVVNARISDRSFPRYLKLRFLWRRILRDVDLFLAQSEEDRRRLIAIGAPAARTRVAGNLKFDVPPTAAHPVLDVLQPASASAVLVCGSTVEGEEAIVLGAFRSVLERYPRALLILAPRRPQRFDEVASLLASCGLAFWRRSQLTPKQPLSGGVLLLDSIGELAAVYALASVAFVGGSLVPRGGHNILEPAQHGVPVLVGPYTENFRDIVAIFRRAEAVSVVTAATLASEFLRLLDDPAARAELGRRAAAVVATQRGATARSLAALRDLLLDRAAPNAVSKLVEPVR